MIYVPEEHFLPSKRAANMIAQPSWKFLLSLVALKHRVMQRDILGTSRYRHIVAARHEAMALIYRHTLASMPQVARYFGKDHSSVHYALSKLGSTVKLVERPAPLEEETPAPKLGYLGARDARGRFSKPRTVLQRAVLRAYQHNIPPSLVAEEYGCNPKSVKVIAHHMGLRRRDFRTKSRFGQLP